MTTPPAEQAAAEGVTEETDAATIPDSQLEQWIGAANGTLDVSTFVRPSREQLIVLCRQAMRRASPRAEAVSDERVREPEITGKFRQALKKISLRKYSDRSTVNQDNTFDKFGKLNAEVCEMFAIADEVLLIDALAESKKDLPT